MAQQALAWTRSWNRCRGTISHRRRFCFGSRRGCQCSRLSQYLYPAVISAACNNNGLSTATATATATATTMRSVATSQRILLGRNRKNKDGGDSTSTSRYRRRRSTSTNAIKCRRQQGCSNLIPCYWSYALVGADTSSAAAIPSVRGNYRSHYETILLVSFVVGR